MFVLPAIPLVVIVTAFVVIGLAATARQNGTAFASWLSGLSTIARLVVGPVVDLGVLLARWITHAIGAEWRDLERLAVTWVAGLVEWTDKVIGSALLWPVELSRHVLWLLDVYLPGLIRAIPHIAAQVVHSVTVRTVRIERTIVRLPKIGRAQARALIAAAVATYVGPFLSDLQWLRRNFAALTHAIPRALPVPTFPAIPNLWKRVGRLERIVAAGLGVGLLARALARIGAGWIRCGKVGRVGRQVCGMDDSLLESLLGDALAIFSVLSVVEFTRELQAVEGEAVALAGRLIREWPG